MGKDTCNRYIQQRDSYSDTELKKNNNNNMHFEDSNGQKIFKGTSWKMKSNDQDMKRCLPH